LTVSSNGNFTNSGTFTANDGKVIFSGSNTISGSSIFNNVELSGNVSLSSDISFSNSLTITSGNLQTNSNKVSLGTSGTITESGGTVIGNLEATRTLSNSTEETFGIMGISITPSCDNLGSTAVTRITGTVITNNSLTSSSRYFHVNPTSNGKATVKINYTDDEISSFNEADLKLFFSEDNIADSWYKVSGSPTVTAASNQIQQDVNKLGYFTLHDNDGFGESRPGSGYALDFDGTNDYVACGSSLTSTLDDFTLEGWINYDGSGNQWFFSFDQGGNYNERIQVEVYLGSIVFGWQSALNGQGWTSFSGGTIANNTWYHVAVTNISSSGKQIFVNGILANSNANTLSPSELSGTVNFDIGRLYHTSSNHYFGGKMDEIRLWNKVLSASEIQEWMTKKITPAHPDFCNLKAYYRFDENIGSTVKDYIGNSNGTINGATFATSAAPTGADASVNATTVTDATTLNLAASAGDDITVNVTSGTADLLQLFRVDGESNNKTAPGTIDNMSKYNYFGVKAFGANSLVYEVVYNWDGHAGVTDESELYLCSRADNASSWTLTAATRDTDANTLTLGGQTGTEFILGSGIPGNVLPVDLLDFKIENKEGKANLIWSTVSEINSKSFEILRSTDAKKWEKVGEVMAQGNSNTLSNYQYSDNEKLNGNYAYYKLKQIDMNGEFTFSNALLFEIENNIQTKIYPNPTADVLTFQFGNNVERNIKISNLMGEKIMRLPTISNRVFSVNIAELPKGFYFVEIESGGQVEVKKILKQ